MANWTKADLSTGSLRRLGLVGAGQSPDSDDAILVKEVIDSVFEQLRKDGLVPFAVSAIPEWAQQPLSKIIASEIAGIFGITRERLQLAMMEAKLGRRQLERQMAGARSKLPIRAKYY